MERKSRFTWNVQMWSAVGMLVSGVALSVAGFIVPPLGEISDSVLWYFSQCLIYAGSVFGVSAYMRRKFTEIKTEIEKKPEL